MKVLCSLLGVLCFAATALAALVPADPSLIEPFTKHLHGTLAAGQSIGENAEAGDYPHHVALFDEKGAFFCSGAIIDASWIATAGHCVDQVQGSIEVRAGLISLADATATKVVAPASAITRHRQFDQDFLDNDIALIKLPTPLTFGDTIKAARLPTYADASKEVKKSLTITGWGNNKTPKPSSGNLKSTELTVLTNSACEAIFGNIVIGTKLYGTPLNVCTGDSGAPVVQAKGSAAPILVGIASFGSSEGCTAAKPVAVTKITSQLSFIEAVTGIAISD